MPNKKFISDCLNVFNSDFFNTSPILGFIWNDNENWNVEAVSKNIEQYLGYELKLFDNNSFNYKEIIHEDDIQRVIEEVEINKKNKNRTFCHLPYRIRKLNNEYIWVDDCTTIIYDSNGDVEYFIGHVTDCTEQIEHIDTIKRNRLELEKSKEEIIKSRQMWIDAIERNGDGLWEWNIVDNSVYFSTQWKKMLGFEENEIENSLSEWEKRVHPDDLQLVFKDIQNYLDGKTSQYNNEHRVLCKDGTYKWVLDRGAISKYDGNNKPLVMVGTHRDITKNKEEENKLKLILKNIPDLVWIKDIDGNYIACNKRFEDFFGEIEENLIGKSDYDYVSKDLANFFRVNDLKALNSDKPLSNIEDIVFSSDGHKETIFTTKTKVLKSDGSVLGVLGIGKDITQLKKKEEEFKAIFNYSIDGLAILDLESNFIEFNDSYLKLTGFTREELQTKSCIQLTVPEDIEKSKEVLKDIIEIGFVKNYEKRCLVKDDKIITINLSAVLLPDKNRILVSTKDITDSKLLETQSKLASMGEMIGNIAHQWRQPLSVISTIASGIKAEIQYDLLDENLLTQNMDSIVEQTVYLSKTIDDFRNFVKNDESKKHFTVKGSLDKALSILKATFKNNDIHIIFEDFEIEHEIFGYENEFIQSIINILNNAKDALKEKTELINRMILISSRNENDKFIIDIQDNAGGIDNVIIKRIFEPYFTTKHKSKGTGLGLSITYKILTEHHNASISVSNKEFDFHGTKHYGACFEIVFNKD